jgi:probable phosphoglycerate mutase
VNFQLTRIFLIRHAEAEGNLYRRAHGQYNGLVTKNGHAQIESLCKRFEGEKIDAVYSSDLKRTITTATAIYIPHNLPLNTTEQLREVDMGAWEDKPWGESHYYEPELNKYFSYDPAKWLVENAEQYYDVRKRMYNAVAEIANKHDGETVAIFSHGFAIRAFLCEIMDIESHEVSKMPYSDNTAVSLLIFENDSFKIEYQNDNSHLPIEISTFAKQSWWRGKKEHSRNEEHVRFLEFDEKRDEQLVKLMKKEMNADFSAEELYTVLLIDKPVGLLGIDTAENHGNAGIIKILFSIPEIRRFEIDIQLLGQAVSRCRAKGKTVLNVSVMPDNDYAMEFYQNFGFEKSDSPKILKKDLYR